MADPGVIAPIHKNPDTTLPKISNFYSSTRFQETNLLGKLYPYKQDVVLSHYALPDPSAGAWENYSFDYIISQPFEPVLSGATYGPTWATHWFKADFSIPSEWQGQEVRFRWDSGAEATLWSPAGQVLQGFNSSYDRDRKEYILKDLTSPQTLYVEAVAMKILGNGEQDQIDPPSPDFYFTINAAEIVAMDRGIYGHMTNLEVLHEMATELMEDPRGYMAMHTANQMVNSILEGDYAKAALLADGQFSQKNGQKAHTLAAIGNCHIDTAWLWPYSETKRKIARSYSSQLNLMDSFPDYIFVASQAQHWAWCEESFKELYDRVRLRIASGQFLPVGTTWVEMDGNMPSGESFIRQFFYGRKFYQDKLSYECKEFWLPDTFGYSAQIPALMKHVNLSRFLTQKMSWNLVNDFPHHNFKWEGIDGSVVLAHFPPGESYGMEVRVSEMMRTVNKLADKGRASTSAFLFGYGDGGGGPTEPMIQRADRLVDTDGVPKVTYMSPNDFFTILESEQDNFMTWTGELFLEMHNGTYTSQADIKRLNRQSEFKLRDSELMYCCAILSSVTPSVQLSAFESTWKSVLLNQFHDVLPGSSIEMVYDEATAMLEKAKADADDMYNTSCADIFGSGETTVVMNTLQWPRREVVEVQTAALRKKKITIKDPSHIQHERATQYYLVESPAFGYGSLDAQVVPDNPVSYNYDDVSGNHILDNGLLRAEITSSGQLLSLQVPTDPLNRDLFLRNGVAKFGNNITIYDDEPLYWDAWDIMDYHLESSKVLNPVGSPNITSTVTATETGSLITRLEWSMTVGDSSTLTQQIIMMADTPYLVFETEVDWRESHRALKTGFDTHLLARNASFDIQFGYVERATHMNTSWDTARYEVCGHKWADLSEPDFGIAILNDSKYGWSARGSSLSLTLLRSPKAPDDNCDMKVHNFKYAVYPHAGNSLQEAEVMRKGYEFNNPLRQTDIAADFALNNPTWSMISVNGDGVVLHTVKPADDGSGDIILRMFECNGQQSSSTITLQKVATNVYESDGLETVKDPVTFAIGASDTSVPVTLRPFQIYALRVSFNSVTESKKKYKDSLVN